MVNILFVCTGNVFRSMIAEKCLKYYLKKNNIKNIKADSAGIRISKQDQLSYVIERLKGYGINSKYHKAKQITKNMISNTDLIISMNKNHKTFLKKEFGIKSPLYNEIAFNKKEGVLDIGEYNPKLRGPNIKEYPEEVKEYTQKIVDYIHNSIPKFVANLPQFYQKL